MGKRAGRRKEKRRHHHQDAGAEAERAMREAYESLIARVETEIGALRDAVADVVVPADECAERIVQMVSAEAVGMVLEAERTAIGEGRFWAERVGPERAVQLAEALAERVEEQPIAAGLAVGLAEESGEPALVERIIDRALRFDGIEDHLAAGLAGHQAEAWIAAGRPGDAVERLDRACSLSPGDAGAQARRAALLSESEEPAEGEEGDSRDQAAKLERARRRFADDTTLGHLMDAIEGFIAADPELDEWLAAELVGFAGRAEEAAEGRPEPDLLTLHSGSHRAVDLTGLAAPRLWMEGPADDPTELTQGQTILGRFAQHPDTDPALARAARMWMEHVRYGFWQIVPTSATGERGVATTVWDLATGLPIHASVPQPMSELPRWTVMVGPFVPVESVWRPAGSFLLLAPDLADRAIGSVLDVTDHLVFEIARAQGQKARRPRADEREVMPYGVLATPGRGDDPPTVVDSVPETTEAGAAVWSVVGSSLAQLVGMAHQYTEAVGRPEARLPVDPAAWLMTPDPAIQGHTPAQAAEDPELGMWLEAALRQIEHAADRASAAGRPATDVDALRRILQDRTG